MTSGPRCLQLDPEPERASWRLIAPSTVKQKLVFFSKRIKWRKGDSRRLFWLCQRCSPRATDHYSTKQHKTAENSTYMKPDVIRRSTGGTHRWGLHMWGTGVQEETNKGRTSSGNSRVKMIQTWSPPDYSKKKNLLTIYRSAKLNHDTKVTRQRRRRNAEKNVFPLKRNEKIKIVLHSGSTLQHTNRTVIRIRECSQECDLSYRMLQIL